MTRTIENCSLIKTCKDKGINVPAQVKYGCCGCIRRGKLHETCRKCPLCIHSTKYKFKKAVHE